MPEVVITRSQVVTIQEVNKNSYGDLTFTDTEGTDYKVGAKRVQHFEQVIFGGNRVQLNYATYKGREYIYSAKPVKSETSLPAGTPEVIKPVIPVVKPIPKKEESMTKDDWAEKERITRKSIERQTALKEATNIACAVITQGKEMSPAKVIETAKLFEVYLAGEPTKSRVAEEAKKLGVVET